MDDVIEFMMAGASAVQIGTMNFVDPSIGANLVDQLSIKLTEMGISDYQDVIGVAHQQI